MKYYTSLFKICLPWQKIITKYIILIIIFFELCNAQKINFNNQSYELGVIDNSIEIDFLVKTNNLYSYKKLILQKFDNLFNPILLETNVDDFSLPTKILTRKYFLNEKYSKINIFNSLIFDKSIPYPYFKEAKNTQYDVIQLEWFIKKDVNEIDGYLLFKRSKNEKTFSFIGNFNNNCTKYYDHNPSDDTIYEIYSYKGNKRSWQSPIKVSYFLNSFDDDRYKTNFLNLTNGHSIKLQTSHNPDNLITIYSNKNTFWIKSIEGEQSVYSLCILNNDIYKSIMNIYKNEIYYKMDKNTFNIINLENDFDQICFITRVGHTHRIVILENSKIVFYHNFNVNNGGNYPYYADVLNDKIDIITYLWSDNDPHCCPSASLYEQYNYLNGKYIYKTNYFKIEKNE